MVCKHCKEKLTPGFICCGNCGTPTAEHAEYHKHNRIKKKTAGRPTEQEAEPARAVGDVLTEADLQKAIRANQC